MAKSVYGSRRTWDNAFWAYGVTAGKAVLVRCESAEAAEEEKNRMKWSNATTVGSTGRAVSELDVRTYCRDRGWKVEVVRGL